jgi:hypothetical protein
MLFFLFVTAAFAGLVAMIVFLVVMASTNTSKAVLQDQQDVDIYSGTVVQSLGTILNLRFVDTESASCIQGGDDPLTPFQRPVTLTMRFRTNNVPDRCDVFVNGALAKSERRIEAECGASCPFAEFNRQFTIGLLDYRDTHTVRVCCDGICVERRLERLCTDRMT